MKTGGIAGASIAEVMGDMGLTVGGFYAYFASKDDLIDQSLRRAMSERTQRFRNTVSTDEWTERLRIFMGRYLTEEHRDDAAMAEVLQGEANAGDANDPRTHDNAKARENPEARRTTLAVIAMYIGGITLARALGGTPLSDELLAACSWFGEGALSSWES